MKKLKILLLSFFFIPSTTLGDEVRRPSWTKRTSVKIEKGKRIRFLGVGQSRSREIALKNAKANAISNFIDLRFPSLTSRSNSSAESFTEVKSKSLTQVHRKTVEVKYDNFLAWCERNETNDYDCYVDAIITKDDYANAYVKGQKSSQDDLEKYTVEDLNQQSKNSEVLKDRAWTIAISPLTGDGFYLLPIELEYAFLSRRLFISINYNLKSNSPDDNLSNMKPGLESIVRIKSGGAIGVNVWQDFNSEVSFAATYTKNEASYNYYNGDEEKIENKESIGASITWRQLFSNSRRDKQTPWGYQIRVHTEDIEEDYKKVNYGIGLFYSF
ncbi:hypothetical protein [Halobacteriovorax sp.]|uniref:hypothetical protein n=1 Tax=Halobacteriovorax sp. TaxID=2020862 RepID=UPI003AF2994E